MTTVLITGANGFLGYYLVPQLLAAGFAVVATGAGPNRLSHQHPALTYRSMDFTWLDEVQAVFHAVQPQVVIHTGAISKPDECEQNKEAAYRVNVSGTANLLRLATLYQCHFIFLSTDFVFDGIKGMYKEDDERAPVNYYGETKVLAEDAVMQYNAPCTIVRTVLVYGKNFSGRENIVTATANALRQSKPLKIFTDQLRTPTYVEDLAGGIVTIVVRKAEGVYHLSGEDPLSPYQIAIATARHIGADEALISPVLDADFAQPANRPPITCFNISKAKRNLGFQPISFAEGLGKTVEKLKC